MKQMQLEAINKLNDSNAIAPTNAESAPSQVKLVKSSSKDPITRSGNIEINAQIPRSYKE